MFSPPKSVQIRQTKRPLAVLEAFSQSNVNINFGIWLHETSRGIGGVCRWFRPPAFHWLDLVPHAKHNAHHDGHDFRCGKMTAWAESGAAAEPAKGGHVDGCFALVQTRLTIDYGFISDEALVIEALHVQGQNDRIFVHNNIGHKNDAVFFQKNTGHQ